MKFVVATALIAELLLSSQGYADSPQHWKRSRSLAIQPDTTDAEQTTLLDRNTAAALVRSATGGRVLGVRHTTANGRAVYQVKVLLHGGHVRIVRIDAETGQLLD